MGRAVGWMTKLENVFLKSLQGNARPVVPYSEYVEVATVLVRGEIDTNNMWSLVGGERIVNQFRNHVLEMEGRLRETANRPFLIRATTCSRHLIIPLIQGHYSTILRLLKVYSADS